MREAIRLKTDDAEIAISVVTVLELAHGITRADTARHRAIRQKFLTTCPSRSLCTQDKPTGMQAAGKRIALADLWIGSAALELGYSVATANLRHFAMIPQLTIEQL